MNPLKLLDVKNILMDVDLRPESITYWIKKLVGEIYELREENERLREALKGDKDEN